MTFSCSILRKIGPRGRFDGGFLSLLLIVYGSTWIGLSGEVANPYSQMELLDDERRLEIGDRVSYSVLEDRERPKLLLVTDRGEVDVPLIGRVEASGKTCKEFAFGVKKELEVEFYYRATVVVGFPLVSETRGEVVILGEVKIQGPIPIPTDQVLTVSSAILRAGGFLQSADRGKIELVRKDRANPEEEQRIKIDVGSIFQTGRFQDDDVVKPDDLILVPQLTGAGGQFYVHGAVNRPGLYDLPLSKHFTVSKAILLAGGFTKFADKKKVKLIRANSGGPEGERTLIVNVADILERGIRTNDPIVEVDDIIRVQERWFNIQ